MIVSESSRRSNGLQDDDLGLLSTPEVEIPADQGGDTNDYSGHQHIYYVHYTEWDRRMDEWISRSRIRFAFQISDLLAKQAEEKRALARSTSRATDLSSSLKGDVNASSTQFADEDRAAEIQGSMDGQVVETQTARPIAGAGKGSKHNVASTSSPTHSNSEDGHATGNAGHGHGHFSAEDLKLHEEATKVKNIDAIVLGKYRMTTWYYCFPSDHQLLTSSGFKFVDELTMNDYIATYNRDTAEIEYRRPNNLVQKTGIHRMIDFVQRGECACGKAAGDERQVHGHPCNGDRCSSHVELSVTAEHDMWCATSEVEPKEQCTWRSGRKNTWLRQESDNFSTYAIRKASSLLTSKAVKFMATAGNGVSPRHAMTWAPSEHGTSKCTTRHVKRIRKSTKHTSTETCLSQTAAGSVLTSVLSNRSFAQFDVDNGSSWHSTCAMQPSLSSALQVNAIDRLAAFVEFSGHWLALGHVDEESASVCCRSQDPRHSKRLQQLLRRLEVPFTTNMDKKSIELVSITDQNWFRYFFSSFREPSSQRNFAENRYLPPWAWTLSNYFVRLLLRGLSCTDAKDGRTNKIFTKSAILRDEIVHICLHAGYSPYFTPAKPGANRSHESDPKHTAETVWCVQYAEHGTPDTQPTLLPQRDLSERSYDGTVYCVNVPNHLVFARKAHRAINGTIFKASRPIIVGNSPFPQEYNRFKTLWFCEYCLSYFGYADELKRHSSKCSIRHPPGNEIYRSTETNVTVAAFEVDGLQEKVYCQNMSYIGKLYLDHKTLEYDCTPFLFYIICELDGLGYHPVGYFSKEKHAASAFNLACILTLPCHQRKGYGKFIISLSYELSKVEERVGSPEKPISDLGQQAYSSYWSSTLIQMLARRKPGDQFSIEELSRVTCVTCDDIIETLKLLKVLQWYQGRWVFSETQVQKLEFDRVRREEKQHEQLTKNPQQMYVAPCRPERLHWVAYVRNSKQTT